MKKNDKPELEPTEKKEEPEPTKKLAGSPALMKIIIIKQCYEKSLVYQRAC